MITHHFNVFFFKHNHIHEVHDVNVLFPPPQYMNCKLTIKWLEDIIIQVVNDVQQSLSYHSTARDMEDVQYYHTLLQKASFYHPHSRTGKKKRYNCFFKEPSSDILCLTANTHKSQLFKVRSLLTTMFLMHYYHLSDITSCTKQNTTTSLSMSPDSS